jgi:hypothetical protein
MTGPISRALASRSTWPRLLLLAATGACGGARQPATEPQTTPTAPRVLPLARLIVLETSGPPPSDTTVTFTAGTPRTIVLYHGGENITFAKLVFPSSAFADSGRTVKVDVKPRPGIYGLDLASTLPLRENQVSIVFEYARYFSAPARARQVYGGDATYERALAVGRLLPEGQVELLPSARPASDNLQAALAVPGSYIVAAPQ